MPRKILNVTDGGNCPHCLNKILFDEEGTTQPDLEDVGNTDILPWENLPEDSSRGYLDDELKEYDEYLRDKYPPEEDDDSDNGIFLSDDDIYNLIP